MNTRVVDGCFNNTQALFLSIDLSSLKNKMASTGEILNTYTYKYRYCAYKMSFLINYLYTYKLSKSCFIC